RLIQGATYSRLLNEPVFPVLATTRRATTGLRAPLLASNSVVGADGPTRRRSRLYPLPKQSRMRWARPRTRTAAAHRALRWPTVWREPGRGRARDLTPPRCPSRPRPGGRPPRPRSAGLRRTATPVIAAGLQHLQVQRDGEPAQERCQCHRRRAQLI